ncbi:MAG: HAMP domain-containing histidine kinase [Bacteroidetes Order II. Incertae sedis bacterium]|nr:HAMP domain-containing histidine kinase [Bacteroidetes Order II. bacterium]
MSIRLKLMLIHGLSSLILLVLFCSSIYYFSWRFRKNEFTQRLYDRVELVEKIHFEQGKLSPENLTHFKKRFSELLPDEKEYVIYIRNHLVIDSLLHHFEYPFIQALQTYQKSYFEHGAIQGAGQLYPFGEKKYAIIVTATDRYGWTKLRNLRSVLFIGSIIAIALIMFTTWWSLGKALQPLEVLVGEIRAFRATNLKRRLSVFNPKDEFGELSSTFNQLLSRLEEAFLTQRHFISNASHEIRNPLAAILGEVELALMDNRDAHTYQKSLTTIGSHAERLNNLINNLLQLSKTQNDIGQLQMEELRVDEILEEQLDSLYQKNTQIDISLDLSLPEHPDALTIWGNKPLFQTVIHNILENALKFSDNKPITVTLFTAPGEVVFSVKDQGIGMSKEDQKLLFEPLYRAQNARGFPGFGIGMALVRRIIEVHKGRILIESELDVGTNIQVYFPTIQQTSNTVLIHP